MRLAVWFMVMPRAAAELDAVEQVLPLEKVGPYGTLRMHRSSFSKTYRLRVHNEHDCSTFLTFACDADSAYCPGRI